MNTPKIRVGVAGFGMMGQMHLGCYRQNPHCEVVAIADSNPRKLSGEDAVAGNIENNRTLDVSDLRTYSGVDELIHDADVDLIDFCLPTRQHASASIAALRAGKHVLCEKPMAWTVDECESMVQAQTQSGKWLMIGHCLRFWSQYETAHQILGSGELGRPLYAKFVRAGGAPGWSRWLMDGAQSGGAVFDSHIHDIDIALWWFGKPDSLTATGLIHHGLPLKVDAVWNYQHGPQVSIYGGWDLNGGGFEMSFEVLCENGSVSWKMSEGPSVKISQKGETRDVEVESESAYAREINAFVDCILNNWAPQKVTPHTSKLAVEMARRELSLLGFEG